MCFFVYIATYFSVRWLKPSFLITKDGYVGWYETIMYPIRYCYAYCTEDSDRIRGGEYTFSGCSGFGEKIFYTTGGKTFAASAADSAICKKALSLKKGDKVLLKIRRILHSDNTFRDYFYVKITSLETEPSDE